MGSVFEQAEKGEKVAAFLFEPIQGEAGVCLSSLFICSSLSLL
jgi:4-aminobutyrate aminotransferase-like enzyme